MSKMGDVTLDADAESLHVALPDSAGVMDVVFDGHRVWSFDVAEHPPDDFGIRRVDWPAPLRSRLDGSAVVELRTHPMGEVVAGASLSFGTGGGTIDLTDDHGRRLSLSKWGRLNQSFSDFDPDSLGWYLDQTDLVLRMLADELGLPAFVAYGTLLGAVRSGHFIGHDMDVDVAYLSSATTPVDAMRESYAVERFLRRKGWRLRRQNGGFLQLFFEQPLGGWRNVDIFTMFVDPGIPRLYGINDTAVDGGADLVLPLGSVDLEGRPFPAPRRADRLLAAAYGPSWRIPDPSFSYGMSPGKRQMRAWFGGFREDHDRWTRLYRQQPNVVPTAPTEFAHVVLPELADVDLVVDAGCGMGRDAIFYAEHLPAAVIGIEVADSGVRRSRRRAARAASRAEFQELNFGLVRQTMIAGARLSHAYPGRRAVVARHLLDAVSPGALDGFIGFCAAMARGGGECILQFATSSDTHEFVEFPGLPKSPVAMDKVVSLVGSHGGRVAVLEQFRGPEGETSIVKGSWQ